MEWGPHIKLARRRAKKGKYTAFMARKPDLWIENKWIWEMFNRLHQARPVYGAGATPLHMMDVLAVVVLEGLDRESSKEVAELIMGVDAAWLEYMRDNHGST